MKNTGKDIQHILVIENREEVIASLRQMIMLILGTQAEITTVASLGAAFDLFSDKPGKLPNLDKPAENRCYDLILLDLDLEDACGICAFHQIFKIAANVPIIVLVGQDEQDTGVEAIRSGATDYIVKDALNAHCLSKSFHLASRNKNFLSEIQNSIENFAKCQERFHSIVQKSTDGIIVVENSGRIAFFNPAAMEQFQLTQDRLIGNLFGHPAIPGDMTEVDILKPDNSRGVAEMRSVETTWNTEPAHLILLRDITERIKTEEQLLRNEKLAALGKLAGILGHEIRSPLGVLKNSIEFVKLRLNLNNDEKLRKHLRIMEEEIEIMNKIVGDILDFARTKSIELTDSDLNSLIRDTLQSIKIPDGIRVVFELAPNLAHIAVDVGQIGRAFRNIFVNALEAMPNGGTLTVGSRLSNGANCKKYIDFKITDTGIGIPNNYLKKILEPLFTTKSKGTGLGLAASRNAIIAHGGDIEIESAVGKGTTVLIRIPLCVERANR